MDHSMFHNRAESLLYRKLRPYLIGDLISAGFPQSVAGSIVNYYNPGHSEYLQRVDAWQVLLCRGAVTERDDLCPELVSSGIIRHTSFNSYSILEADPWMVYHIHTVIRLFYKFRGEPRSVQDFESVKSRLTSCPNIHLYTHEILGMRKILYENLIPPFSIHEMEFGFGPGASADVKGTILNGCLRRLMTSRSIQNGTLCCTMILSLTRNSHQGYASTIHRVRR